MSVFVILPAAGIGTRMAAPATIGAKLTTAPKQFLSLKGLPILIHSLQAFLAVPRVTAIYVAVREAEQARVADLIAEHKLSAKVHVVTGGDARQDSVANALAALPSTSHDDIVLVHDAVRPLIDPATIDRTIAAIEKHGAAIVAFPAIDTIKQVERTADGALITSTIPRELIVHAQTPQGAKVSLMRQAFSERVHRHRRIQPARARRHSRLRRPRLQPQLQGHPTRRPRDRRVLPRRLTSKPPG
jgi:2-C-methyl-D-erythritol 4-phosphate cytidylyltransferase